ADARRPRPLALSPARLRDSAMEDCGRLLDFLRGVRDAGARDLVADLQTDCAGDFGGSGRWGVGDAEWEIKGQGSRAKAKGLIPKLFLCPWPLVLCPSLSFVLFPFNIPPSVPSPSSPLAPPAR